MEFNSQTQRLEGEAFESKWGFSISAYSQLRISLRVFESSEFIIGAPAQNYTIGPCETAKQSSIALGETVRELLLMRPEPKKKIATNQPQAGLNQAFAKLEVSGLPKSETPAPAAPAKEGPGSIWKLGRVVLRKETAHRGGKTVIVVHDFATHLPVSVIETVAKKIRQQCGCGGAVKGRTIEIQGDQPARIRAVLEAEGFKVAGVS